MGTPMGTPRRNVAGSKGEGSLKQNKTTKLWEVRIELPQGLDGKRRRKVVRRKSRGEAIEVRRQLLAELHKAGDLATSSSTLDAWSAEWLESRADKLAPNTVAGYRTAFAKYINPMLGSKKLDKITPSDIKTLHKQLTVTPKSPGSAEMLSSTYRLLVHNTLSGALKAAVREGKISRNVCEMVDRPTKRHTDERALTGDEAIKLLMHLSTHPQGALWATYLFTGARRGEVIGLEVERVTDHLDLSWQIQRIADIDAAPANYEYRHLENRLYLVRPKSKAGWRTPPLVEPLASILRRYIGDRTQGLVFLRDGRPWDPADASKEWKILLAEAGLPTDVKLHGARHTVVDLLYEAEVPEPVIMEIVGHSTRSVTRSYRSKGNQKIVREALERMSSLVSPADS